MPKSALPTGCEILLLEDDAGTRRRLAAHLKGAGATVTEAGRVEEARDAVGRTRFDFALLDLHLPDGEGLDLLREHAFSENTVVVVMTAFGGVKKAVEAIKLGAADYLSKPFETEQVILAFTRAQSARSAARRDQQRSSAGQGVPDNLFFGESLSAVRRCLDLIVATEKRLERNIPPVLIEGETGTGKSALARWLHANGPRHSQPFVSVNCAALPDTLAEAELFGHERGAFTDAKQARIGLFEAADGGTLFLDEVGSLSPSTQTKLLVAVEEGRIRRLGSTKEVEIDTRLIAASNQPLDQLVAKGRFREDLFHRLHLLHIGLPPLRQRGRDILALANHLLGKLAARHRLPNLRISPAGEARLLHHPWKGNVRELAHELERAVIFGTGETLDFPVLGDAPTDSDSHLSWRNRLWQMPEAGFKLDDAIDDLISEALRLSGQNVSAAARRLGVTREFLRYRLQHSSDHPENTPGSQA